MPLQYNNSNPVSIEGRYCKYVIELNYNRYNSRSISIIQIDSVSGRSNALNIPEVDFLEWIFEMNRIGNALGVNPPSDVKVRSVEIKAYTVADKRVEHPKAYMPWTVKDEDLLAELFHKGTSIDRMSDCLQRNRGAIRSRLIKLGLAENFIV